MQNSLSYSSLSVIGLVLFFASCNSEIQVDFYDDPNISNSLSNIFPGDSNSEEGANSFDFNDNLNATTNSLIESNIVKANGTQVGDLLSINKTNGDGNFQITDILNLSSSICVHKRLKIHSSNTQINSKKW